MKFITTESFEKAYSRMSNRHAKAVDKALRMMQDNLRYPSLRVRRVLGTKDIWEARAGLAIRITFKYLDEDTIQLRNIGTHDQVFRSLY